MQDSTTRSIVTGHEKTYQFSTYWLIRSLSFPAIKYCPKRQHFSYVGMQAHIKLAILDHNYNTQCKQAPTKHGIKISKLHVCSICIFSEGKARYLVVFLKGRKSWVAKLIL